MGCALVGLSLVFTDSLRRASRHLQFLGCKWNLQEELSRDISSSRLAGPAYSQPICTALQLALCETLATLGVRPTVVIGHSSGEIAAAYAAGALSFEDALTIAYHRGHLTAEYPSGENVASGAMLAVGLSAKEISPYLARIADSAGQSTVACYNSPSSITVSGDVEAIHLLKDMLDTSGVFNRLLRTKGAAYHSHHMKHIEKSYFDSLANLQASTISTPMFSSVTGKSVGTSPLGREYWVQNLISPVKFQQAIENCRHHFDKLQLFLEVGPHETLGGPVKQTLKSLDSDHQSVQYFSCLNRKFDAFSSLLSSAGELFSHGVAVDLHTINNGFDTALAQPFSNLPKYPFDHSSRYWHESRLSKAFKHRKFLPHELLGNPCPENDHDFKWRRYLILKELPWLRNHVVQGQIVFPAAGYLTMALEALKRSILSKNPHTKILSYQLNNVSFGQALILVDDQLDTEIILTLSPEPRTATQSWQDRMDFRISTISAEKPLTEHCRGRIRASLSETDQVFHQTDRGTTLSSSNAVVSPSLFYNLCRQNEICHYEPFDNFISIRANRKAAVTTAKAPNVEEQGSPRTDLPYTIHPGMLDTVLLQTPLVMAYTQDKVDAAVVPTFVAEMVISATIQHIPETQMVSYGAKTEGNLTYNVTTTVMMDGQEQTILQARGVELVELPGSSKQDPTHQLTHRPIWTTWCDNITRQRLDAMCNLEAPSESAAKQNQFLNDLTMSFCKTALSQISDYQVVQGHQQYYFKWMQSITSGNHDLPVPSSSSGPLHPFEGMTRRVGANISALLTGKMDPVSLLMHDRLMATSYKEFRHQRCYQQIQAFLKELGQQNPGLEMLEIGGGSASIALPILQACNNQDHDLIAKYHFTDISSGFFHDARQILGQFSKVLDYQTLNIEHDVGEQGFEKGAYDVVVAFNVLHATSSLDAALEHAKSLLRPKGRLLLMEYTSPQLYHNFIYGILPGWWAGAREGRDCGPLLTAKQWTQKLTEHGFSHNRPLFVDFAEEDGGTFGVFAATTAGNAPVSPIPSSIGILESPESSAAWSSSHLVELLSGGYQISRIDLHAGREVEGPQQDILIMLPEVCEELAVNLQASSFRIIQTLVLSSKVVVMLSRGSPNGAVITGLANTLRVELPSVRFVTLDLDPQGSKNSSASSVQQILQSYAAESTVDPEVEFRERGGQIYIKRMIKDARADQYLKAITGRSTVQDRPFLDPENVMSVGLHTVGLLETFHWRPAPALTGPLDPEYVRIEVRAASINFREVLVATGQLRGLSGLKNDCSGVIVGCGEKIKSRFKIGDRVCAYYGRSYSNYPVVKGDWCCKIPDGMSYEVVASLPIVWTTVYRSLIQVTRLQPSERILIHSGAGAVGQAAVSLAQHLGAEMFATVGSEEKMSYLTDKFNIPRDHLFSSRNINFKPEILRVTDGQGVDVVLNSLSGAMTHASCDVLAPFGRFVEIGKKDLLDNALLPTKFLLENISFTCVNLTEIIEKRQAQSQRLLQDTVDLVASGQLKATQITTYPISHIEHAFRFVASGKHTGKVVLSVEPCQVVKALPSPPPLPRLHADGIYIVVGGLGGLGRCVVKWLADRGAQIVVTLSRSGTNSEYADALVTELQTCGTSVIAKTCDIASESDLQATISELQSAYANSHVRGVIHSAMSLQDVSFEDMTYRQWHQCLAPKVQGTWNLHNCLPKELDFFILFSSTVAIHGNGGQTNYGAACSFQDSFAAFRTSLGFKTYAINVGSVRDAGFTSETPSLNIALERKGYGSLTADELLANLDYIVSTPLNKLPSPPQNCIGLLSSRTDAGQSPWSHDRRFSHLTQVSADNKTDQNVNGSISDDKDLLEAVRGATTASQAEDAVSAALLRQLSKLTMTPVEQLSPSRRLDSYGVDSLITVELKRWIDIHMKADISVLVIRETKNIQHLTRLIAGQSKLVVVR